MGSERQSLIDVELARTEFRLDVIKLRQRLGEIVPALRPKTPPPAATTVNGVPVPAEPAQPAPSSAGAPAAS
jgi:hypothetical protein